MQTSSSSSSSPLATTEDKLQLPPSLPSIPPWHAKYPEPKLTGYDVGREEVLGWLKDMDEFKEEDKEKEKEEDKEKEKEKDKEEQRRGKKFLLVDLRRVDCEGGTIKSSLNLPAQSLYAGIPMLFSLAEAARVEKVVFYCGSSRGRGPRAAGWFQDYIASRGKYREHSNMTGCILVGGIKGWANAGEEFTDMMDDYDAEFWDKVEKE